MQEPGICSICFVRFLIHNYFYAPACYLPVATPGDWNFYEFPVNFYVY
jgi:hypothetical protein